MTNLSEVHLHDNQLTGNIPSEIGNLTNLGYLMLYNNQLTGVIPPEICNIAAVSQQSYPYDVIRVENNQLCPPYPSCISQQDIDSQDTSNCP